MAFTQDASVQVSFLAQAYIATAGTVSLPTSVTSIAGVGTAAAPNWTQLTTLGDATLNITAKETDISIRGVGGIELTEASLKSISVELSVPYIRGDPKRETLWNSLWQRTPLGIVMLDGAITDLNSSGVAMDYKVFGAPIEENIAGVLMEKFTLKPCMPGLDTNGSFAIPSMVQGSTAGTLTLLSHY